MLKFKHKKNLMTAVFVFSLFFMLTISVQAAASVERVQGDDRYKTAVEISKSGWDTTSEFAVLATGDDFPDALSAAPLAKMYKAPILLTGRDALNSDTAAELVRLQTSKVFIIGGTGVISENVENELKSKGLLTFRLAGADRYETSIKVAEIVGTANGIVVATGSDFPDAVSAAPIAAKKTMPIILSPQDELTTSISDYIGKNNIPVTYVLGNADSISDNVLSKLPNARRIGGYDKYERNINIINEFSADLNFSTVYVATGNDYPDALAAAALAQSSSSPVILVDSTISESTKNFISSKSIDSIIILGGTGAVSESIETELGGSSSPSSANISSIKNVSIEVEEDEKYDLPETVTATTTSGDEIEVPVTWKLVSIGEGKSPTYIYDGYVEGYSGKFTLTVKVKAALLYVEDVTEEIIQYSGYTFPKTVTARLSDGSTEELPVTWDAEAVNLNKIGTYTFNGTVDGYDESVNLTLKVIEDEVVEFDDDNLEDEIRGKIRKSRGTIRTSDILDVDELKLSDEDIEDLSGLEYFTNLKYLDLGENNIEDIDALEDLTKLETLKLDHNLIEDITPLKNLTNLKYLDLKSNYISDIWPLKYLNKLETLYLDDNPIDDYSPVRGYYDDLEKEDFDPDF